MVKGPLALWRPAGPWTCSGHSAAWENRAALTFQQRGGAVKALSPKKLDEEKQEICNQLNRRTEFIVLRTTYGMFDEKGNLKNTPKPKTKEKEPLEEEFDFLIEE